MVSAILYTTNSGYTKQYAQLLSELTGLPAYNLANSIPPAMGGAEIIYMGWLMAGGVQGYKKASDKYRIKALCTVGMAPKSQDQTEGIRKKYGIASIPVFYLQGGFDIKKLHGIYKFMMKAMSKKILGDMSKIAEKTPEQQEMVAMCTDGKNCVSKENLQEVLDWFHSLA